MSLPLTCDCGARFDVDDLLAGKEVACPECGQAVAAPARAAAVRRLSLWAVASAVLVLIGAFTVIGTLAGVLVGLWALVVIRRQQGRLTGSRLALASIAGGVVLSLVTSTILARPDLMPLAGWLRQRSLGGQIDSSGTLQMVSRSGDVVIDRPSREWGRARNDQTNDPVVGELQQKLDLLLVNVRRQAYVDVVRDTANGNTSIQQYEPILRDSLNPPRAPLLGEDDSPRWGGQPSEVGPFPAFQRESKPLEDVDGHSVQEVQYEQSRGGQKWWFLVRIYKKTQPRVGDPIIAVRAYTPKRWLEANEEELRSMLDSVRIGQ
jgi:hypothetical protein